jgi:hypothetical protein
MCGEYGFNHRDGPVAVKGTRFQGCAAADLDRLSRTDLKSSSLELRYDYNRRVEPCRFLRLVVVRHRERHQLLKGQGLIAVAFH